MKIPRNILSRKRVPLKGSSYTELYKELLAFPRQDAYWFVAFMLICFTIYWMVYLLASGPLNPKYMTLPTVPAIIGSITTVMSFTVIVLIYFLMFNGSRNLNKLVPEIAVYMIVFAPRPYQKGLGLAYKDVQQLKRSAEIEQGAADWRGNFVNFVIISIVIAIISNPSWVWQHVILPIAEDLFNLAPEPDLLRYFPEAIFPTLTPAERMASAILTILIIFWLFYQWLSYFRKYFSSEIGNRTILLACEEVLALYSIRKIDWKENLQFHEKCDLIQEFGYHLVSPANANLLDKSWAPLDLLEHGTWYLIPPVKDSLNARFSALWNQFRKRRIQPRRSMNKTDQIQPNTSLKIPDAVLKQGEKTDTPIGTCDPSIILSAPSEGSESETK